MPRQAAQVAVGTLRRDQLDADSLSRYERAWRTELDEEFHAQSALRDVVTMLSDESIDSFFELAHTDGIMPIVHRTASFNRHRKLILALFKHPPVRQLLLRRLAF